MKSLEVYTELQMMQIIYLARAKEAEKELDLRATASLSPDEVSDIYQKIKGVRRVIFSLMLDLNLL